MAHSFERRMTGAAVCCGLCAALVLAALLIPAPAGASDPFARSRDYDLQHVRTHLRFDLDKRMVMGEVTQNLAILRDGVTQLKFDSEALNIESVTLGGKAAKFETPSGQLVVTLPRAAKRGEQYEVNIRYTGTPKKGLYFVLPDKDYPDRPKEIWSQGEDEDTRAYIPIYDYPNDRTTSEMLLTVPSDWLTISNGQLVSVKQGADGTRTWDWRQTQPLSTYLISVVAGEFKEAKDTWRGMPLEYVVPKGDAEKVPPTFQHTKAMLDLFSDKLGVRYPWAKYAQTAVDDFVVGGMENTSATTLTTRGLVNPKLAGENAQLSDGLISHEMAHQWFGDLVTCKDWANLWLNEGFATFYEHLWTEQGYGPDAVAYEFWRDADGWMQQKQLFTAPIVNYDTGNQLAGNGGNIYTKGGWVLRMLREKLGDDDFFRAMHHYLDTNRGQNVVTADLIKAIEQATGTSVQEFFQQWVYGAGAPQFEVKSTYDSTARLEKLEVKQTQKVEGHVGLFHVPVEVEITTASGRKSFPIEVSKADETYTFSVDGPPLMVLFDKGNKILKSVEFHKDPQEWVYQLKNAEAVPDRADAAKALGEIKGNDDVVAALGTAALHDGFYGVRQQALIALGKIGGPATEKQILAALDNEQPWVRDTAVEQLGNFKEDATLPQKLENIAREDKAYRVRGAALHALAQLKAPNAFDVLAGAVKSDSPDDVVRTAALRAFGALGDDRAVPLLLEWSSKGKPLDARPAAISSVAQLDKKNHEITRQLAAYLSESHPDVRFSTIFSLGQRGDPDAIPALEALIKSGELSIAVQPFIQGQIERIRAESAGKAAGPEKPAAQEGEMAKGESNQEVLKALAKVEHQMAEMNQRLQTIEARIAREKQ